MATINHDATRPEPGRAAPLTLISAYRTDRDGPPGRPSGVDASTVATLVFAIPSVLANLALVTGIAVLVGLLTSGAAAVNAWGLPIMVAWLLSGLAALWDPMEDALARLVFGFRQPTAQERRPLDSAWQEVRARAGVGEARYTLWVEISDEPDARSTGAHTLAVTQAALKVLSTQHLQALLARQLGHHLHGHALARSLAYWYSAPTRLIGRMARHMVNLVVALYRLMPPTVIVVSPRRLRTPLIVGGALGLVAACLLLAVGLVMLPLACISAVQAGGHRRSELGADHTAAQLGYRSALTELLYERMYQEEIVHVEDSLLTKLVTNQPTPRTRILALETL